jgi:hypothetical protein
MALYDINQLKTIGMMQNTFMWEANVPMIPYLGINNLRFLIRSSNIPGKTRHITTLRYMGEQFNLPMATSHEGKWTCGILMDETHNVYDQIIKWHEYCTQYATGISVNTIKTEIQLKLLSVNKNITTKRIRLLGAFPEGIPSIDQLDQSQTEGVVVLNLNFAIDDIDHNPTNAFTW